MSNESKDIQLAGLCKDLLTHIGEDPEREGLIKTPQRYAQAVQDLTVGYKQNVADIVGDAVFKEDYSEMVIVKNIEFYSLCEHHLLPFFGYAHVAYVPNGKIIGLSKIPRIVNMFARRLQVQERLTGQISHGLFDLLQPQGVGVMIEASHMCMMMRGTQVQASRMITNSLLGEFLKDAATRDEFFKMVAPQSR